MANSSKIGWHPGPKKKKKDFTFHRLKWRKEGPKTTLDVPANLATRWAIEDLAYITKLPRYKLIEAALRHYADFLHYTWPDDAAAEAIGHPNQYELLNRFDSDRPC